jgi:DNA-binding protein YbaB
MGKFGDLFGMMGKMKEAQQEIEALKARLEHTGLQAKNDAGTICVRGNANKVIQDIQIDPGLMTTPEALQQALIPVINDFIQRADDWQRAEIADSIKDKMPNIPGLEQMLSR